MDELRIVLAKLDNLSGLEKGRILKESILRAKEEMNPSLKEILEKQVNILCELRSVGELSAWEIILQLASLDEKYLRYHLVENHSR